MELHFTGTGAAYYPRLGSNAAFFVKNNHLFMIDCGESTFRKRRRVMRFGLVTRSQFSSPICTQITLVALAHLPPTVCPFSKNASQSSHRMIP